MTKSEQAASIKADFNKMFDLYWYQKKALHRRLCDSMDAEREVCALFFETLNDYGILDKVYPK